MLFLNFAIQQMVICFNIERRKVVVHIVGAGKEADLLPLFECLLPLFPKTDIFIHMIGKEIISSVNPKHCNMNIKSKSTDSSIFLSFTHGLYSQDFFSGEAFKFGDGVLTEPDLVLCMNATLYSSKDWDAAIKMVLETTKPLIITEKMEQLCMGDMAKVFQINPSRKINIQLQPNPFRAPVFEFKKDVNFPAYSNGFIFGYK